MYLYMNQHSGWRIDWRPSVMPVSERAETRTYVQERYMLNDPGVCYLFNVTYVECAPGQSASDVERSAYVTASAV